MVSQKFADGALLTVMPEKACIQKSLKFLDFESRYAGVGSGVTGT
jgi:hypothetical protein